MILHSFLVLTTIFRLSVLGICNYSGSDLESETVKKSDTTQQESMVRETEGHIITRLYSISKILSTLTKPGKTQKQVSHLDLPTSVRLPLPPSLIALSISTRERLFHNMPGMIAIPSFPVCQKVWEPITLPQPLFAGISPTFLGVMLLCLGVIDLDSLVIIVIVSTLMKRKRRCSV